MLETGIFCTGHWMCTNKNKIIFCGNLKAGIADYAFNSAGVHNKPALFKHPRIFLYIINCSLGINTNQNKVTLCQKFRLKFIINKAAKLAHKCYRRICIVSKNLPACFFISAGKGSTNKSKANDTNSFYFTGTHLNHLANFHYTFCNIIKLFRCKRLSTIAQSLLRIIMNFNHNSIGSAGSSSHSHRLNHAGNTGSM